jgi:hypothetical protein
LDPGTFGGSPLTVTDEIRSFGVGVSLSGMASTVAACLHREPTTLTRYTDLAFGINRKRLVVEAGDFEESVVGIDWGLLARGAMPFRLGSGSIPARVEAAYAYSVQSANDVAESGILGAMVSRPHRHSVAAHFGLDTPRGWRDRMPAWLAPGLDPLVSLGGAWDREFISFESRRWDRSHLGFEMGLGNIAFVRFGDQNRSVWGYGLALPIGRLGGVRYDEARSPGSDGFPEVKSHGWSVWANFMEIGRTLR